MSVFNKLLLLVANVKLADNADIDVKIIEDIISSKNGIINSAKGTLYISK